MKISNNMNNSKHPFRAEPGSDEAGMFCKQNEEEEKWTR